MLLLGSMGSDSTQAAPGWQYNVWKGIECFLKHMILTALSGDL